LWCNGKLEDTYTIHFIFKMGIKLPSQMYIEEFGRNILAGRAEMK